MSTKNSSALLAILGLSIYAIDITFRTWLETDY